MEGPEKKKKKRNSKYKWEVKKQWISEGKRWLIQESAGFLYQGSDNKRFRLRRTHAISST